MGRIKTRKLKSESEKELAIARALKGLRSGRYPSCARQRKSMGLHLLPYAGDSMKGRIELLDMKDNSWLQQQMRELLFNGYIDSSWQACYHELSTFEKEWCCYAMKSRKITWIVLLESTGLPDSWIDIQSLLQSCPPYSIKNESRLVILKN